MKYAILKAGQNKVITINNYLSSMFPKGSGVCITPVDIETEVMRYEAGVHDSEGHFHIPSHINTKTYIAPEFTFTTFVKDGVEYIKLNTTHVNPRTMRTFYQHVIKGIFTDVSYFPFSSYTQDGWVDETHEVHDSTLEGIVRERTPPTMVDRELTRIARRMEEERNNRFQIQQKDVGCVDLTTTPEIHKQTLESIANSKQKDMQIIGKLTVPQKAELILYEAFKSWSDVSAKTLVDQGYITPEQKVEMDQLFSEGKINEMVNVVSRIIAGSVDATSFSVREDLRNAQLNTLRGMAWLRFRDSKFDEALTANLSNGCEQVAQFFKPDGTPMTPEEVAVVMDKVHSEPTFSIDFISEAEISGGKLKGGFNPEVIAPCPWLTPPIKLNPTVLMNPTKTEDDEDK